MDLLWAATPANGEWQPPSPASDYQVTRPQLVLGFRRLITTVSNTGQGVSLRAKHKRTITSTLKLEASLA